MIDPATGAPVPPQPRPQQKREEIDRLTAERNAPYRRVVARIREERAAAAGGTNDKKATPQDGGAVLHARWGWKVMGTTLNRLQASPGLDFEAVNAWNT